MLLDHHPQVCTVYMLYVACTRDLPSSGDVSTNGYQFVYCSVSGRSTPAKQDNLGRKVPVKVYFKLGCICKNEKVQDYPTLDGTKAEKKKDYPG